MTEPSPGPLEDPTAGMVIAAMRMLNQAAILCMSEKEIFRLARYMGERDKLLAALRNIARKDGLHGSSTALELQLVARHAIAKPKSPAE